MISLGVCTNGANAKALATAGFDYLEENFSRMTELSDGDYRILLGNVRESGLACEAFNGFLPGRFVLLGDDAGSNALHDFIHRGFSRAAELGGKLVVFGSGVARRPLEGMTKDEALERFAAVAADVAGIAAGYQLKIAIEPLRATECGFLNMVGDAFEVVRRAGFPPALGVHADLYHMASGGDGVGNLVPLANRLYHCHIAEPVSRQVCRAGEYDGFYGSFFRTLKSVGYAGRVSFEGGGFKPELAPELFRYLDLFR